MLSASRQTVSPHDVDLKISVSPHELHDQVIMLFGEIDCREGLLLAVQKLKVGKISSKGTEAIS